ncbi:uncharacterized protein [Halyomorpha halys]|uniref:uncharacterized protein n=1 Tax=Halyomorpha halys TaxID=286706 RepID=UPI0006D4E140|nr:uncharacterized protein LOC106678073 [Halyomorpha halys]
MDSSKICASIVDDLLARAYFVADVVLKCYEEVFRPSDDESETENVEMEEMFKIVGMDKEIREFVSNRSVESSATSSEEKVCTITEKENCQMMYINSPESSMESVALQTPRFCQGDVTPGEFADPDPICYMSNLGLVRDEKINSIYSMDDDYLRLPRPSDLSFKKEELYRNCSKDGGVSAKHISHNEDNERRLPRFQDRKRRKPVSKFYSCMSYISEYFFRRKLEDAEYHPNK